MTHSNLLSTDKMIDPNEEENELSRKVSSLKHFPSTFFPSTVDTLPHTVPAGSLSQILQKQVVDILEPLCWFMKGQLRSFIGFHLCSLKSTSDISLSLFCLSWNTASSF